MSFPWEEGGPPYGGGRREKINLSLSLPQSKLAVLPAPSSEGARSIAFPLSDAAFKRTSPWGEALYFAFLCVRMGGGIFMQNYGFLVKFLNYINCYKIFRLNFNRCRLNKIKSPLKYP